MKHVGNDFKVDDGFNILKLRVKDASHSFSSRRSSSCGASRVRHSHVLNKHFQNALHISITQFALIQVTTYLGYFLMAIPGGHVHQISMVMAGAV